MKKIKYKVGKKEDIGSIPYGSILEAYLVTEGDSSDGLIYFPKNIKWTSDEESGVDGGCGSLGFGCLFDEVLKIWVKSDLDYVNLSTKESRKYEKK